MPNPKAGLGLFPRSFFVTAFALVAIFAALEPAHAAGLSVTPITWDVIGLDSNLVTVGPQDFPVGARVCNTSGGAATNVTANFVWDSTNSYINSRPGTLTTLSVSSLASAACTDFYFEVEITRDPAAYNQTRQYHIAVTANSGALSGSTPTPREIFVEHLISQSRNAVNDIQYGTSLGSLTSVTAGGSMTLLKDQTYYIRMVAATATNGYEQLESFISFPNTIFQVLGVSTTYSADTSVPVSNPNDKLYGDGCTWEPNPLSLNYRSCLDVGKVGGDLTVTYQIKIISVPSSPLPNPEPLTSLIHDFSGSSFHYNADFDTSVRFAYILDPAAVTMTKAFVADTIAPGASSTLTFRITNPSPNDLTGVNFTDTLPTTPGAMTVAATPAASTTGCGTPTFSPTAGATSLSFSNGTIPANSTCVITVAVTASVAGTYANTTGHLFINGTVDTGNTASASLIVDAGAVTCLPGQVMAQWTIPSSSFNPPDAASGAATTRASNVNTATAVAFIPAQTSVSGTGTTIGGAPAATFAWSTWGYKTDNQTVSFTLQTKNYSQVTATWAWNNASPANGPTTGTATSSAGGSTTITPPGSAGFTAGPTVGSPALSSSTSGNTTYTLAFTGANTNSSGGALVFDNITFTGCSYSPPPTLAKAFSPKPIQVNGTSTLTFTITNPGTASYDPVALTGVQFTDTLPTGLVVATPNGASTTCSSGTVSATAGGTSISLSGATLAASGSCTVTVNVKGAAAGSYQNVSGRISSTQSGQNNTSTGFGSDTITVIAPPTISKTFGAASIQTGQSTSLSFTVTNPNVSSSLSGIAFTDSLPSGLIVATPNGLSGTCGGGTISAVAASSTVSLSGATLSALGSCTFSVNVTGTTTGTKTNTTGAISSTEGGTGGTATDTLIVRAPNPSISLLKQISTSSSGPWTTFVNVSVGASVYYQLTIENTGDVALSPVTVTDPTVTSVSSCTWPSSLAIGATSSCVIGPVTALSGFRPNTATASGTYSGTTVSDTSTANYSTTGLTLVKLATETSFTAAGNILHYTYGVTNTGAVTLAGPVTIADSKTTVTCPSLTTIGNGDTSFQPGESIACTSTYTVLAADVTAGGVTNTATATVSGVNSNTATVTVPLAAATDLQISKTDGTTTAKSGGSTTYTIQVTNNGPSPSSATLSDPAVAKLTKTSIGTCTATGGATCPAAGTGSGQLGIANLEAGTVAIPSMPVGSSISFTVTVAVSSTFTSGSVTNTATVTASGGTVDFTTSNNTASDTDTPALNFGHLPSTYTNLNLLAQTGAYHLTGSTYLGATVPVEADGVNNASFTPEVADDGVTPKSGFTWSTGGGGKFTITVVCPAGSCYLAGWMDWGNDGAFSQAGDQIIGQTVSAGTADYSFSIPAGTSMTGYYFARFRLYASTPTTVSPGGQAITSSTPTVGEVEDYEFQLSSGLVTRAVVSYLVARESQGSVLLEWQTISETGTVGFMLQRFDEATGAWVAVNDSLLPAVIVSPRGATYRYFDPSARPGVAYSYRIIEVESSGRRNFYGPWTANTAAAYVRPPAADRFESNPSVRGYAVAVRRPDPKDLRRAGGGAGATTSATLAASSTPSIAVRLGASSTGLYYESYQDLAARGGLTNPTSSKNALTNRSATVAFAPTADGTGILYFAQATDSPLEKENVYRFGTGVSSPLRMKSARAQVRTLPTGRETFLRSQHLEKDVFAAPGLFTDGNADFWMWDWIFAGYESRHFSFRADGAVTSTGSATLTIRLKGGSDTEGAPDHHAQISVNGSVVGDFLWNGLDEVSPSFSFPAGWLVDGENVIEVAGLTDTTAPYSLFYVDSIDVRYVSRYRATANRAEAPVSGNASVLVSGFTRADIMVFDVTNPREPIAVQAAATRTTDGTYGVALPATTPATVYLALTPDALAAPSSVAPDYASSLRATDNRGEYLVLTTRALKDTAQTLATYRTTGNALTSQVIDIDDVYDEFSSGIQDPRAIRSFLAYAKANWALPPKYVVLAGDGTFDLKDSQGLGGNLIPPMMVGTPEGLFPSDNALADLSGGAAPEIAIGRLPVSTPEELAAVITKIQNREAAAGSDWMQNLLLTSDAPDHGEDFGNANETVAAVSRPLVTGWVDLGRQDIDTARAGLFAGLQVGSGFVNYFGHGGFDRLSDQGLLTTDDIAGIGNARTPTILTAMTCIAGNTSVPGFPGIGEVLVRQPLVGAAAVIAPSGLSQHEHAVPLARSFYVRVAASPESKIGDVLRGALSDYESQSRPSYMLSIYTLLGDPAMRVR